MKSASAQQMNPVLACLAEEHRHMSALLHLLDERAGKKQSLTRGDYCLMRDVVGYLHDYPDSVHHPTEDLLFECLSKLRPDLADEVSSLREQHVQMEADSARLLQQLDQASDGNRKNSETAIRKRTRVFSRRQLQHMQRESRTLFPAAMKELRPADWKKISRRSNLHVDPLFGPRVHARHRTLFEFLLDFDQALPARFAARGIDVQERLELAFSVMEQGAGESLTALLDAVTRLTKEARSISAGERRPGNLRGLLATPWSFGWYMGRTTLGCGWTLLGISTASTKAVCEALFARNRQ